MKVGKFNVHIVIKTDEGEIKTFDYKDTPLSDVGNLPFPSSWTIQFVSAKRIPNHKVE